MIYPKLAILPSSSKTTNVFRGYNKGTRINDGEFSDMQNLTSDSYPVLSPRRARGIYVNCDTCPTGITAKEKLCYTDGTYAVIGEERIDMGLSPEKKQLVSMGAYLIIMPDKKYINVSDTSDRGEIDVRHAITDMTVSYADEDGTVYSDADVTVSESAPSEPAQGDIWIDTSDAAMPTMYVYNHTSTWEVKTFYTKITWGSLPEPSEGWEKLPFAEGDNVTVRAVIGGKPVTAGRRNIMTLYAGAGYSLPYVLIQPIDYKLMTEAESFIIESANMPDVDFVTESGNRLWACRYGLNANGETVNEIYASALGDFRYWETYEGISTDAYAVSVGSDGPFTAAVTYLGYPIFFKENCYHKIYGSYPAQYQVQTTQCRGVQDGCAASIAFVNEVMYYLSRSGVVAYDGSLPIKVSDALGDVPYANAAAGALGDKYYISASDADGNYHLFVHDTARGLWHREDDTQATAFCEYKGELYYIDYATCRIMTVRGTGMPETSPIRWSAVSGVLGVDSPDKKYISRIDVRMQIEPGAKVTFYAEYDSSGEWEYLFTMTGTSLRSFTVPVRPKRCDHMSLAIRGTGAAKIFSIRQTIEQGSEA